MFSVERSGTIGRVLALAIATLTLVACSKKASTPPAVEVSTVVIKPQAATVGADYVAQTEAVNTVEIRPRVGGVLERQLPIETGVGCLRINDMRTPFPITTGT